MSVATDLLSMGLQSWGQSMSERRKAWQTAIDAMGLVATITPDCVGADGPDAELAQVFIKRVKAQWPMGKFEDEEQMIAREMAR